MSFSYYKWALVVVVSETRDGMFEVSLKDPDYTAPFIAKKFKRGDDPSAWVAKQTAKHLPKWIARLHSHANDDYEESYR